MLAASYPCGQCILFTPGSGQVAVLGSSHVGPLCMAALDVVAFGCAVIVTVFLSEVLSACFSFKSSVCPTLAVLSQYYYYFMWSRLNLNVIHLQAELFNRIQPTLHKKLILVLLNNERVCAIVASLSFIASFHSYIWVQLRLTTSVYGNNTIYQWMRSSRSRGWTVWRLGQLFACLLALVTCDQ